MDVVGIVLAAGEGRRMGGTKALRGPLAGALTPLEQVAARVHDGGCELVVAVIGAEADALRAAATPQPWLRLVEAPDWSEGMGASLRAGLRAALAWEVPGGGGLDRDVVAALVTLVDLPDVRADVVVRLLATVPRGEGVLARASYRGEPGHPALIGRAWWPRVLEVARGEAGARELFATTPHLLVECGDLATGRDADVP